MGSRGFAAVGPISLLEGLQSTGALGYYNLVLSHNVLQHQERFAKLVKRSYPLGGTWIVDNSVIELGRPASAESIAEACKILEINDLNQVVAVLPDELLDMQGTVRLVNEGINSFEKARIPRSMFVPQGKTVQEVIECCEIFQDYPFEWIGVARNFETEGICSREWIIPVIRAIFPKAKIHLLGFTRLMRSDITCAKMDGVCGIDSSMPLRLDTRISLLSTYPKRGDWWQEDIKYKPIMGKNVLQVRKWLEA